MKTKLLFFLLPLFTFAQIEDDMESYTVGLPIIGGHWTDWDCGGEAGCAIMSTNLQANSGTKSGLIPDDETTDAVVDLGSKVFGEWDLSFSLYVPSNQEGYFNMQGTIPIVDGEWIIGEIYFNEANLNPGGGRIFNSAIGEVLFDFPHDVWFVVSMYYDLSLGISNGTWAMLVDGIEVIPYGTAFTNSDSDTPSSLGGIDFWSSSADCLFYVDDILFTDEIFDIDENSHLDFSIYPSPTTGILNIESKSAISQIEVYNQLGQLVASNSNQNTIDISRVNTGLYFMKIKDVNGNIATQKVMKK